MDFHLSLGATLPLLLIIGIFCSTLATMIGIGSGLIAIPLILAVIGFGNSGPAKLITFASIFALGVVGLITYHFKHKHHPDFKVAAYMLVGVVPISVICEIYVGPILQNEVPAYIFHFIYAVTILFIMASINLRKKLSLKKTIPLWTLPIWGMLIGVLSGTLGLSGGVLFVPLLAIGLKKEPKDIAINTLLLTLVTAGANVITGLGDHQYQEFEHPTHGGVPVYWWAPLAMACGSLIGSQIGPLLNRRLSEKTIVIGLNLVPAVIFVWEFAAAFMIMKNVIPA